MSCKEEEIVPEPYRPTNAHEAYLHSLQRAQLVGTALGRDWLAANHRALHQALPHQDGSWGTRCGRTAPAVPGGIEFSGGRTSYTWSTQGDCRWIWRNTVW